MLFPVLLITFGKCDVYRAVHRDMFL